MSGWVNGLLAALAVVPTLLAWTALIGLGLHRHAPGWAVAATATLLVYLPAVVAVAVAERHQTAIFFGVLGAWSTGLVLALPVYFPGERQDAVRTGLASMLRGEPGARMAREVADRLPSEPEIAEPEPPLAQARVEVALPPPPPLERTQIALPYEGDGRRLAIPVVFTHEGREREVWMLLDTGATFTTLPLYILRDLGLTPGPADPEVTLHTANGVREARLVLVDEVWLGDQAVSGVAIATCEECASQDTVGLLGLNVSGGFNLLIDADRHEAVFSARVAHDRRIDVGPFVELEASFTRFPGGRVEVVASLRNDGPYAVARAEAAIACGEGSWTVPFADVAPGATQEVRQRLPEHAACAGYRLSLAQAAW